jgi:hypothetical protein
VKRSLARVKWALAAVAILASIPIAYQAGYRSGHADGLHAREPQYRYLLRITHDPRQPNNSTTHTEGLFDINKPEEAASLRREVERLESIGADFYITTATVERSLNPDPDPRKANAHR